MESALYDFYSLVEAYQKTHSFAALTRSFSDTSQLVNKNSTRALYMNLTLPFNNSNDNSNNNNNFIEVPEYFSTAVLIRCALNAETS